MPTPAAALHRLREGNARFVAGTPAERHAMDTVHATAERQRPYAAMISCIDSRVPVETVFDLTIGQAFSARVAGHVIGGDVLGSLEFAAAVAGVRLAVVLGHTNCGAIKGACDGVRLGHLSGLLGKVRPAVEATPGGGDRSSQNAAFVDAVARVHVLRMVDEVLGRSAVIRGLVDDGKLGVVGAMYDVRTGLVRFLTDLGDEGV